MTNEDNNINSIWTGLTMASLGKKLGELTVQYSHDPAQLARVRAMEERLSQVIFEVGISEQANSHLMELVKEIAAFKKA